MALNRWIGVGRLTADPELRQTPSGTPVARVTVAVNRPYQKGAEQKTDFLPVVIWRAGAEFCAKYLGKGDPIQIEGRVETRSYDDRDGIKRYVTEIIADNVSFVEGANRAGSSDADTGNTQYSGFEEITDVDDDELPF